jgi:tol-pal system protein YbgF
MQLFYVLMGALTAVMSLQSASAQDAETADQLNRLERDVRFLQRQIYRGSSSDPRPSAPASGAYHAELSVEISELREEMRTLHGKIEKLQHKNAQLKQQQERVVGDMEFRIKELEDAIASMQRATVTAAVDEDKKRTPEENTHALESGTSADTVDATEEKITKDSDSHYNRAFELLNQKDYAKAAASFNGFLRAFPNDPLVPNAYYWLGESYYARGDYVRAANGFRRGYESDKDGQKAPDNLLKLGLSLANVKRKEEACVILGKVVESYPDKHYDALREKASESMARLKCA